MTLTAQDVRYRIGSHTAVDGVSVDVRPGELLGLVGPNGAGKSTLLRLLAGLLAPQQGTVTQDGAPLASLSIERRARRIGYLAQAGEVHWPLSVERLVALGRLPHLSPWRQGSAADRAAIARAMDACDVTRFAGRTVATLSGGERARVLLARALAVEPAVLLADEPAAGLDPHHQLRVMDLVRERAQAGMAVVVVLHDLGMALRTCDRVLLMDRGRAVACGPAADVLDEEAIARVYDVGAEIGALSGRPVLSLWRRA
jgi:iron complex transport system ATP-binding protein